jgi:hypothetical protein
MEDRLLSCHTLISLSIERGPFPRIQMSPSQSHHTHDARLAVSRTPMFACPHSTHRECLIAPPPYLQDFLSKTLLTRPSCLPNLCASSARPQRPCSIIVPVSAGGEELAAPLHRSTAHTVARACTRTHGGYPSAAPARGLSPQQSRRAQQPARRACLPACRLPPHSLVVSRTLTEDIGEVPSHPPKVRMFEPSTVAEWP